MVHASYVVSAGGRSILLRRGAPLRIGRDERNDLVLADPSVSRFHARLEWPARDGPPVVVDLDSTNGTMVDGVRARRATLGELARLTVGDVPVTVMLAHPSLIPASGRTLVRLFDEWRCDASGELREAGGVRALLLQLERGRRTVSFLLVDDGFEARLTFAGGRVVAARAGGLRGADALSALLSRREGGRYHVSGEVELCGEPEDLPTVRRVVATLAAQAS